MATMHGFYDKPQSYRPSAPPTGYMALIIIRHPIIKNIETNIITANARNFPRIASCLVTVPLKYALIASMTFPLLLSDK